MKLLNKLAKILIFGALASNQAVAQNIKWGSYQAPIPDSSFNIFVTNGLFLNIDETSYDSIVWQADLGFSVEKQLLLSGDVHGRVLVKKNNSWSFKNFSFTGLQRTTDSLFANNIEGADYTWTKNGVVINSKTNRLGITDTGAYKLTIKAPFIVGKDVSYSYYVSPWGATLKTALFSFDILSVDSNKFSVNTIADSIVWDFNGTKYFNNSGIFYALENGDGALYVKRSGIWNVSGFSYQGFLVDGMSLKANVKAKNATYSWFKDGQLIQNAKSGTLEYSGSGVYSLHVNWIPEISINASSGTYTKQINTLINPLNLDNLILRAGNTFSINPRFSPDSIRWVYSDSNKTRVSSKPSITINTNTYVGVMVYQKIDSYTQNDFYYKVYTPLDKGSFTNPIDSTIIIKDGTTLSADKSLAADSIIWTIKDTISNSTSYSHEPDINVYNDCAVSLMLKFRGRWIKQLINFRGISYDPTSRFLQAPIIKDAQYDWFINGKPLGVNTSSYLPTEPGIYKVYITWTEHVNSISNTRLEDVDRTAEYTFAVNPKMVTGLNESISPSFSGIQLYPNPALDFISVSNVEGNIDYHISSVTGAEIQKGKTVGDSKIDISNLEDGVYLINIKTPTSQITRRIIVK